MDDLEFRRRAYAEPDCQDKDFIDYKNKSIENTHFVDELNLLDETLKSAIQIKPPEDLLERVKLKQALELHQLNRQRYRYFSLAASVVLVLIMTYIYQPEVGIKPHETLTASILEHIYHELDHLQEQQNKSLAQVNTLLSDIGVNMSVLVGDVNYLGSCDIANKKGVHMVVQGSIGPITVMVLPDISVSDKQIISDKRFRGLIVPKGKGSIAIVGEKSESLLLLQEKLVAHMRWI